MTGVCVGVCVGGGAGGGVRVVNKDLFCYCKRRLRVVPHFSSGRVERAKREWA